LAVYLLCSQILIVDSCKYDIVAYAGNNVRTIRYAHQRIQK